MFLLSIIKNLAITKRRKIKVKNKMKFAVITAPEKAEIHEHEVPSIKPNEILIKNMACNLCTTDYQQWMGLRRHQPEPMAFGHENSGLIEEVGEDVKGFNKGEQVVVNNYLPCMECANCRKGMNSLFCLNRSNGWVKDEYGYFGRYGCGEYQIFQSKHVIKINNNIPFSHAGFSEPLATVLHGMKRLRVKTGEKTLVIGVGTMGLINAQTARYYGADVIISEISEKKRNTAKKLGFDKIINAKEGNLERKVKDFTNGKGLDSIIIAVGNTNAYNQAIEIAPKGCRLLIFAAGYPEPEWHLKPNPVHYELLEIIGTLGCSTADFVLSAELLSNRTIDVSPIIEDEYKLENVQDAFTKAASPDNYRVTVRIQK
jgi:threonine dehydrogenase-like Zn-dependent dehydrogenase